MNRKNVLHVVGNNEINSENVIRKIQQTTKQSLKPQTLSI